jgi:protein-S-isoprenylcysteine O-methyltransferase Ste14
MKIPAFLYGVGCYGVFFLTFLYAIAFVGGFSVPRTVDAGGPENPAGIALVVNAALLGVFGLQHSIMARQGFKRWWTRLVPAPVERSTYVLFSSLALILLFWQWRPIPAPVWDVQAPSGRDLLWALFALGWLLVLLSTFLISHFDLFGLRQVWQYLRGRRPMPVGFGEPFLYRLVRHPLYVGFIVAFWAIPTMTAGHLEFALVATGYILVGVRFEERDLKRLHPEYAEYSRRVPMLVPRLGRRKA